MSCRWSFEGSLARTAVLRDSRCTKPCVFPDKVHPRTSMIYLCGATGARRSRVWSDHSRTMVGSFSDRFRIVNGVSSVFRACAVDRIPLWFATVGSFPQCKWDCKWCWWMSCRWSFEGSLARTAFLRDSRCTKPCVFLDKVRPRTSMIYFCGATGARRSRVWSDHSRTMVGSFSDRFRIVNGVASVFRACAVDRIPLWFATVGSFPQCKWDCKWCWWMSCRWSFEGSLARNAFLALVIFLLKILLKSASKSSFFRSGVEIRFWSYNFRRRCA